MGKATEMTDRDPLLDDLFRQARENPPVADSDFMARILADAVALQPVPRPIVAAPARRSLWSRLITMLGGAAVIAGLGSAAMAGLVIGYVQPAPLTNLADSFGIVEAGDSVELLPGLDGLLTEE